MLQKSMSRERTLYLTTATVAAMTPLVPFLGLTATETRAILALAVVGVIYRVALIRAQMRFGWARLAPIVVPTNVLIATLAFAILSHILPTFWIIYFVLPLVAALLYGKGWTYLAGFLAAFAYLVITIGNQSLSLQSPEEIMNAGVLIIFTVVAGHLAESERRHAREQEVLNVLAAAVNQSLALNQILDIAMDRVLVSTQADAIAIFGVEGEFLNIWSHRGVSPELFEGMRDYRIGEGLSGRVARTGKIEVLNAGAQRDPRLTREAARRSGFEAYVGVPLNARGVVVGVIGLGWRQPRPFTASDLAFLQAIADHLATAMANARLYDESQARAERLALLNEFSALVNRELGLKDLMFEAQKLATRLLSLKSAWIIIKEELEEKFALASEYELPSPLTANDRAAMRWSPCRCQRMLLKGELTEPVNIVQCERFESAGIAAFHASVPLKSGERILGLLNVMKPSGEGLGTEELQVLKAIGAQLGIAIEREQMHEQVRTRRIEEQAALLKLSQGLVGLLDVDAILNRAAETAHQVFHADFVSLMLPAESGEHLILRAGHGWEKELYGNVRADMATSWQGYVFRNGVPLQQEDVQTSTRFDCPPALRGRDIHATITFPLIAEQSPLGTLCVHFRVRRTFSDDDVRLGSLIANQTALAYERARKHHQAIAHVQALTTLNRLAESIVSTIELESLLQTIVDSARPLANAQYAALVITNGAGRIVRFVTAGISAAERARIGPLPQGRGLLGALIQGGKAIRIGDLARDPRAVGFPPHHPPMTSFLGVPIVSKGRVVGDLYLTNKIGAAEFSAHDQNLVETLAAQAAIAIDNARLFTQAGERLERITALHDIDVAITSELTLEQTLDVLLEKVGERLRVEAAAVALIAPETQELNYAARHGLDGEFFRDGLLKVKEGIVGQVAHSGKPMAIVDVSQEPRFVRRPIAEKLGIVSYLAVPLRAHGEIIGVLELATRTRHDFSSEEVEFFETLAGQAAIAIEKARLFEETRQHARRLETLYQVGQTLNSTLETETILENVIDEAMRVTGAGCGCVLVADQARSHFTYRALQGFTPELTAKTLDNLLRLDQGLNGLAYRTQQVVAIDDVRQSPDYVEFVPETRAELVIPLVHGGQVLGNIDLQSPLVGAFGKADIGFLRALADQAAIALDNARLFETERAARTQAETLRQVAQDISGTLNLAQVLRAVLNQLKRVIVYDTASVLLLGEGDVPDLVAGIGYADEKMTSAQAKDLLKNSRILSRMTRTLEPVIIPDVRENPEWIWVPGAEHVRTFLCAPVVAQGRMIGALMMDNARVNFYHETDARIALALAQHLAIAIENTRLFEAEQTRRTELAALYDLSRALVELNDMGVILNFVVQRSVEKIRVTFARIALIEGDECVLRAAYPVRGLERDLGIGQRETIQTLPLCFDASQQNAPMILRHDAPNLSEAERAALFLGFAQSLCLVPLRSGDRALGLLMLGETRRAEREPFTAEKINLARGIGDQAASALHRAELFAQLERSYLETVLALANAVDAKDTYTADHAKRLAVMALAVGRELGLGAHELVELRYGAILHDIGKIGVPDAILRKPGKLDDEEWKIMRHHPEIGSRILAPVPRLAGAARIVRHHHERYDGKGYPDRLVGEAIPLGARILTVVDSFSAIMDARVYKAARSQADAVAELKKHTGTQFDARVVETFLRLLERGLDITGGGGVKPFWNGMLSSE